MLALKTRWGARRTAAHLPGGLRTESPMVAKGALSRVEEPVRLTELASCAGCAAKAGAEMLAQVLSHLSELQNGHHPNLLVGLKAPDDATVYRLDDEHAVVLTVDFFAPLVDAPYEYGGIPAAPAGSPRPRCSARAREPPSRGRYRACRPLPAPPPMSLVMGLMP